MVIYLPFEGVSMHSNMLDQKQKTDERVMHPNSVSWTWVLTILFKNQLIFVEGKSNLL